MEKWLYCTIMAIYIMYHIYLHITSFITFAEVDMHREGYYVTVFMRILHSKMSTHYVSLFKHYSKTMTLNQRVST